MLVVICSVVLLALLLVWDMINKFVKIRSLPPGPIPLPFIGNTLLMIGRKPDEFMLTMSKKYGGIFTIWMPVPTVVITDTELLMESIGKSGYAVAHRPVQYLMTQIYQGTYGLFFNDNRFYKTQRRFAVHTMATQGEFIFATAMKMCVALKGKSGDVIEMRPFVMKAAGNIIHKILFGEETKEDDKEIEWFQKRNVQVFEDFVEPKMLLLDSFPFLAKLDNIFNFGLERNLKANKEITDFLYRKIDENKAKINYDDTPSNYVDAFLHEMKKKGQGALTDEFNEHQLAMSIFDLYSAGMETIVIIIRACVLFMLKNPEMKNTLFKEVDNVLGKDPSMLSFSKKKNFPYVQAFLQEVYRICYIMELGIFRETSTDIQIEGFHLPPGTRILPQFPAAHMDPAVFSDPEKFDPERHLNKKDEFVKNIHINPFSLGRRNCLGEYLGRQEVFLFFVILIRNFDFLPEHDVPPPIEIVTKAFRTPAKFTLRVTPRPQNLLN